METGEPIDTAGSPTSGSLTGQGAPEPTAGMKSEVKSLLSDAKEETSRIAETAKERVSQTVTQKKDQAAEKVDSVAGALRDVGQKLQAEQMGFGRYAENVAQQADRLSQYLRSHDLESVVRDAQTFARRHPEVFLGGAFVAGMIATRFLKSSAQREHASDEALGGGEYNAGWGPAPADPFNTPHFSVEDTAPRGTGGGR